LPEYEAKIEELETAIQTGLTLQNKELKAIIDFISHLTLISSLLFDMMKMASFQTQDKNSVDTP
jgi:hypothetical protein